MKKLFLFLLLALIFSPTAAFAVDKSLPDLTQSAAVDADDIVLCREDLDAEDNKCPVSQIVSVVWSTSTTDDATEGTANWFWRTGDVAGSYEFGASAQAVTADSIAVGDGTTAGTATLGNVPPYVGAGTQAGIGAIGIGGVNNTCLGGYAVCIGGDVTTDADAINTIAIGNDVDASGLYKSVVLGDNVNATAPGSSAYPIQIGYFNQLTANSHRTIQIGTELSNATGEIGNIMFGHGGTVDGDNNVVFFHNDETADGTFTGDNTFTIYGRDLLINDSHAIVTNNGINLTLTATGTGRVNVDGNQHPSAQCTTGQILKASSTGIFACDTDATGAGGSAIILDLADDAANESTDITEIATTGDTNGIASEPAADKLLLNMGTPWLQADALTANGANCTAGSAPLGVDAAGAAETCTDFEEDLLNEAGLYAALSDVTQFWEAGDTINSGAVDGSVLTANTILEAALKAVDVAADEECLTYEATGGDFEWQACGSGGISNVVEDTTPQLGGQLDVNTYAIGDGTNELIDFVEDASAVNHVEIENQATGGGPMIRSAGTDTNIDLNLEAKGSGSLLFETNAIYYATGTDIPVTDGGTGSSTAGGARTNLGLDVLQECIALSDRSTDLTTGTGKANMYFDDAITISDVRAWVSTAPTGATITVDINEGGTSIMTTTKLTIDATEKTSGTAATDAVLTDTAIAANAELTFDIDQIGSTVAGQGLVVCLEYTR